MAKNRPQQMYYLLSLYTPFKDSPTVLETWRLKKKKKIEHVRKPWEMDLDIDCFGVFM